MSNLETIIPLIVAGLTGLLALYFKGQADKAGAQNIESEVKEQDAPLKQQQEDNRFKIEQVDKQIDEIKASRGRSKDQTDEERADSWNKPKQ